MDLKQLLWLKAKGGSSGPKERTITGNPVTFSTKYAEPMTLEIQFSPIQAEGIPSPDNVLPISGFDAVNIGVNGKNFCPLPAEETKNGVTLKHNEDGSITVTGTNGGSATYFDCVSDFDSTLFAGYLVNAGYDGTNATVRMRMMYADGTSILNIGGTDRFIPDSGKSCRISVRVAANYAIPDGGITLYPMLHKPGTDSTFEAYTGTVTPVSFPSTSYGGTLTVNADGTGTLTVTHGTYTVDNAAPIRQNGTHSYYIHKTYVSDAKPSEVGTNGWCISDKTPFLPVLPSSNYAIDGVFINSNGSPRIQTKASYDTAGDMFAAIGTFQIVYELDTPVTYSLTPGQVESLIGMNNVWTNTNGENTVTYIK